ncbi:MAG: hypothetical protein AB1641_27440 [Thermodesulfobacteriota bacterium]
MTAGKLTKKQVKILKDLEKAARRSGLRVSYGKLNFAGLKLKGGQCLFRGEKWLVLDRRQPFEDQMDIFREAMEEMDLEAVQLSGELRVALGLETTWVSPGRNET